MRIGIDVDGVVYDFDKVARDTFLSRALPEPITYGQCYKLQRPGLGWDGLAKVVGDKNWGWLRENAAELRIFDRLAPIPGGVEALRSLIAEHGVYMVTSRPRGCEDQTYRWLANYNLCPKGVIHSRGNTKHKLAADLKLDAVVDDGPENLKGYLLHCRGSLKGVRIYGIRAPWNEKHGIDSSYYRFQWVGGLQEVANDLKEKVAA